MLVDRDLARYVGLEVQSIAFWLARSWLEVCSITFEGNWRLAVETPSWAAGPELRRSASSGGTAVRLSKTRGVHSVWHASPAGTDHIQAYAFITGDAHVNRYRIQTAAFEPKPN